jgi:predicted Zn-dependent protease
MAALSGGKPPELLSTHPSDETRFRKLTEHMDEALKYYKP